MRKVAAVEGGLVWFGSGFTTGTLFSRQVDLYVTRIQDSIYSYMTIRNIYVKSEENIRKPPLLHKTLTDHIYGKCILQLITEL